MRAERLGFNQYVLGSNPSALTNVLKGLRYIGARYDEGKDLDAEIRRAREWQAEQRQSDHRPEPLARFPTSRAPLPHHCRLPSAIRRKPSDPCYPVPRSRSRARFRFPRLSRPNRPGDCRLAAQAHADVVLPFGQTRPLSLFLVTIAGSGDRKSSADNEALRPIRAHETGAANPARSGDDGDRIDIAAWAARRRRKSRAKAISYQPALIIMHWPSPGGRWT